VAGSTVRTGDHRKLFAHDLLGLDVSRQVEQRLQPGSRNRVKQRPNQLVDRRRTGLVVNDWHHRHAFKLGLRISTLFRIANRRSAKAVPVALSLSNDLCYFRQRLDNSRSSQLLNLLVRHRVQHHLNHFVRRDFLQRQQHESALQPTRMRNR
jgi:hypothetical protein